jgi:ankyrin repeat protein
LVALGPRAAKEARGDEAQAHRPEPLLFQAIRRGDSTLVASLLRQGTPADLRGENGTTPLLFAARYRNAECLKLLLDHGADPNAASEEGVTALQWGAGSLEVVRLLLERWADPRARTKLGNTPLICAAAYPGRARW